MSKPRTLVTFLIQADTCTCYLQMSHNKILIGNDFILLVIVKALNY